MRHTLINSPSSFFFLAGLYFIFLALFNIISAVPELWNPLEGIGTVKGLVSNPIGNSKKWSQLELDAYE